jgi:hypothetical protein
VKKRRRSGSLSINLFTARRSSASSFWTLLMKIFISRFTLHNPIDQLVEFGFDPGFKIRLNLINFAKLGEGPAPVIAQVIHARHPIGFHGRFFLLGILAPVALNLDDQIQQIVLSPAIVNLHNEIKQVFAGFGAVTVRDSESGEALDKNFRGSRKSFPDFSATSVSQIAVSTAST